MINLPLNYFIEDGFGNEADEVTPEGDQSTNFLSYVTVARFVRFRVGVRAERYQLAAGKAKRRRSWFSDRHSLHRRRCMVLVLPDAGLNRRTGQFLVVVSFSVRLADACLLNWRYTSTADSRANALSSLRQRISHRIDDSRRRITGTLSTEGGDWVNTSAFSVFDFPLDAMLSELPLQCLIAAILALCRFASEQAAEN